MTTFTTTTSAEDVIRASTASALRACAPALRDLGRALAELRAAMPEELRGAAERDFMNAFGNAVWSEGRRSGEPA